MNLVCINSKGTKTLTENKCYLVTNTIGDIVFVRNDFEKVYNYKRNRFR